MIEKIPTIYNFKDKTFGWDDCTTMAPHLKQFLRKNGVYVSNVLSWKINYDITSDLFPLTVRERVYDDVVEHILIMKREEVFQ